MERKAGGWLKAAPLALLLMAAGPAHKPIDLPGARLFPENMYVLSDGTAYVGSASGGILKVSLRTGKVTRWAEPGAFGTASIFGVLVDPVNRLLWVCSNDLSGAGVTIAGADKGTRFKAFDLATGKGKISLAFPGENRFCNDAAVGKDGAVYVTETNASHIYRWKPGASVLEDWLYAPAIASNGKGGLDGVAFGGDGNLYVNNWQSNAIARIAMNADGSPGAVTRLTLSRTPAMADGFRLIGGLRFAMAEGAGKVSLVTVDGDKADVRVLVDGLTSATGVGVYDGAIWYVQGEVSYIFNAWMRSKTPPLPFRITPVPLPPES